MQRMHMIFWKYDPTTADFNRCWGLAKGLAEHGINVECDFILPNNARCTSVPNGITCNYWGDINADKGKLIAYICSIIKAISVVRRYKTILSSPCASPIMSIPLFFSKKENLYLEKNEYPIFIQYAKKISSKIKLRLNNWVVKKCAGTFVISNKLRDYYINIGAKPNKIHVINMTVDINRFTNLEESSTEPYICYCGTVSNIKDGVDILLESFGKIANDIPNVKLYILGCRPYKKDNEKNDSIIEKYGIRDRIFMPGPISGNEMPQYLKNAKVLALARPDNIQTAYGFPTKLGEYLMTGNPVVVTQVGELEDFLEDGKSCLFAEPNNAIDFAEKLKWTLLYPKEAEKIGINGKMVAEASFNYKIESKKIADIIQERCFRCK